MQNPLSAALRAKARKLAKLDARESRCHARLNALLNSQLDSTITVRCHTYSLAGLLMSEYHAAYATERAKIAAGA